MSKEKQFEYIEARIRQAVNNSRPAFNIKAWAKMEALLDKEEKKQKPFYWWIVLLLFIAGGVYLLNYNNVQTGNTAENILNATDTKHSPKEAGYSTTVAVQNTTTNNILDSNKTEFNNSSSSNRTASGKLNPTINKSYANVISDDAKMVDINSTADNNKNIGLSKTGKKKVTIAGSNPVNDAAMQDVKNNDQVGITGMGESTELVVTTAGENNLDSVTAANLKSRKSITDTFTPAQKNGSTPANKKSSRIYFLASIGPDIGSVKLFSFSNSSVAAKYGAGAGYQLTKKLSLQTGFYAGKKKYIAGPKDYHTKKPLPPATKIISVTGDCLVFEIPFSIRYDMVQNSSISYYTILGLSSYVMKDEHYEIYRTVYNNPYQYDTAFSGNRHLFSMLSFSAGIEKKISKSVSLQLEPSVSLPLSGVGQGKVKLFSSAIMLGVKYRPFRK